MDMNYVCFFRRGSLHKHFCGCCTKDKGIVHVFTSSKMYTFFSFLTFPGSTTYGYLSYPHSTLSKVGLYKVARPRMYAFLSMLLYDWLVVSWHLSFNLFTKSQSKSSCSRFIWLVDAGLAPRWLQMVSSIVLWDRSSVVKDTILPVIK